MDVNTGKDGAVATVDGRLFHTGIHRENKRAVVLNNSSTKAGERLYVILWDFPLVREVLRDNSRRAKRLNYTGSYKKKSERSFRMFFALALAEFIPETNYLSRRIIRQTDNSPMYKSEDDV